jgi:hypothetical protein
MMTARGPAGADSGTRGDEPELGVGETTP